MGGALLLLNVQGQIKPQNIGDTMPPLIINHVVNYKDNSINLHQRGKATIIDFFETHCGGCIELLPYLNEMYNDKKDSLSVYVVADEPAEVINHFLKTNPNAKNISLPFFTSDTLLNKLFKHHSIPHEVWIGNDQKVKAITSSDYVTESNIEKLCEGKPLHLPIKNDYFVYDPKRPLSEVVSIDRLIVSSTFACYTDNLPKFYSSIVKMDNGLQKKIIITNSELYTLLSILLKRKYSANRFIINVRDSSKLLPVHQDKSWFINHSYCYEITVPDSTPDSAIVQYALNDIGKALNLEIRIINKEMSCYELIKTADRSIDPKTKGGNKTASLFPAKGKHIMLKNYPISFLVKAMNSSPFGHPAPVVLDGTHDSANLDIELPLSDIHDLTKIDKALRPYGYRIIQTNKSIDMVLIRDLQNNKKEE